MIALSEVEVNEIKKLSKIVFDGVRLNKIPTTKSKNKFFDITGLQMAHLALDHECQKIHGSNETCEKCNLEKKIFGDEYDLLVKDFKDQVSLQLKVLEQEVTSFKTSGFASA